MVKIHTYLCCKVKEQLFSFYPSFALRHLYHYKLSLYEDYSDLTSPSSNNIPDIHIAVSVVYYTLEISVSSMYVDFA